MVLIAPERVLFSPSIGKDHDPNEAFICYQAGKAFIYYQAG